MNPAALIAKLHQGMKLAGSRVQYNEKVTRLQRIGDHFRIVTNNSKSGQIQTIRAKRIVSAAGPYTGELLGDLAPSFKHLISIKRLFLVFFKPGRTFWESLDEAQKMHLTASFPVAEMDSEIFYAMLDRTDENGIPLIKAGGHFLRTDIRDLDQAWEQPVTITEQKWAESHILDYLANLGFPCNETDLVYESGYSCVYSLTASEIPYVTRIPDERDGMDPNAVVIAGLSGVGAKGALAYGLHAADLLLGRQNTDAAYQKASKALGEERLREDMGLLEGNNDTRTPDSVNTFMKSAGNTILADGSIFFRHY
jgi:glycine/D-amino acid oxidase-like deaminating enzyme